jgi:uncharacterized protein YbjT (DUF2867 family)
MTKKVFVTGATGNIGSQLVPRLAAYHDIAVQAFVYHAEKAAPLQAVGAELALGSFEDTQALWAALGDIDTIVLITAMNPNAADQAYAVLTAAKAAGVRKIVRISALKAALDGPTDNTRLHGRTDSEIQASGLAYTILRPHFYMQNLFMAAHSIASEGKLYMGMGGGKLGMIDVRDIVDCAEQSVRSEAYNNQIFTPTGPARISFHDIATTLTNILGRPIQYVPVPPKAVAQSIREMGWGEWAAQVLRDYAQAYSENWGDFTTDDVERLTGHPARSFEAFAREVFAPALRQAGA